MNKRQKKKRYKNCSNDMACRTKDVRIALLGGKWSENTDFAPRGYRGTLPDYLRYLYSDMNLF